MQKKNDLLTIIFWLSIIFFLDPGGYIRYYYNSILFGLPYNFVFLCIAYLCFIFKLSSNKLYIFKNKYVKYYLILILVWFLYYFVYFYWLNNHYYPGLFRLFSRNTRMISQGLIVFPIIYFSLQNLKLFVNILTWTTIIILILFIISVITGTNMVHIESLSRGFIDANRYVMYGYGLIYFSLPLALSVLLSKYKINAPIIISGILVVLLIVLKIARRDIIGIFECLIIIFFIYNYIQSQKIISGMKKIFSLRIVIFIFITIITITLFFPGYIKNVNSAIQETIYVIKYSKTTKGKVDIRMSLTSKTEIVKAIKDNVWGGTGHNPDWMEGDGGKKGWEGSDYVFMASFAMYGVVGLLCFLPFYIITVKVIFKLMKIIKYNRNIIFSHNHIFFIPVIVGVAASSEFIRNIIEYPNWFYPIAATAYSPRYFIYFGLLLGSYYAIQKKLIIIKDYYENEN
ncbi:MAG: hypothetical protein K8S16_21830 [Bacteroidales bacterium]|nr:hypothetical protein [Bacteroidales bacterium]